MHIDMEENEERREESIRNVCEVGDKAKTAASEFRFQLKSISKNFSIKISR